MGSSIRNSRKPYRALSLAGAVSLLLGTAAQAADHNFVLTAYSNGRGGADLISGNYAAAAKSLHSHSSFSSDESSTTSNNRCVALAMTKDWDSARIACDQAVRDAQQEKTTLPSYRYWASRFQDENLAVALSNRAVMHWLSADNEAAASDLKKAAELAPKAAFVTRNVAALEYSHTTVAQVSVAPTSP